MEFRQQDDQDVIRIRGCIGSSVGVAKNAQGGFKFVKEKPKEVTNFNVENMNIVVNIYEYISIY